LEKRFFKTFSAENSIFSQHFWGIFFHGIFPEIFPGKNVRKIGPKCFEKRTKKYPKKIHTHEENFIVNNIEKVIWTVEGRCDKILPNLITLPVTSLLRDEFYVCRGKRRGEH
jgi:hypothetical protein